MSSGRVDPDRPGGDATVGGRVSPTVIRMSFTVPVGDARVGFDASVTAFSDAVASLPEWDLMASSRCHGWTRLDLNAHVVAGWQEMLGGFVTPVDDDPTVDAASYWTAFADMTSESDRVAVLMAQRRRAAAYTRPSALVEQLRDVAGAVLSGSRTMGARAYRWQGQVFAPGDFLAIWAVENVVHHLDLLVDDPPPPTGLTLARATIEALAADPLPADWPGLPKRRDSSSAVALAPLGCDELSHTIHLRCPNIQERDCGITPVVCRYPRRHVAGSARPRSGPHVWYASGGADRREGVGRC